jgi:hypothetical protein
MRVFSNSLGPKWLILPSLLVISIAIFIGFYISGINKKLQEHSTYLDYLFEKIEDSDTDSERRFRTVLIYNAKVAEYNTLIHSSPYYFLNNVFEMYPERKPLTLYDQYEAP